MATYRGLGSAGSTTDSALVADVTQKAVDAAASASAAATSATGAAASASSAASSATDANTYKTSAASSANNASNSASAASTSASNAATSETNAATSETNAAASETAAAASETAAAASETAAASSESNASTSETNAAASASAAATSASNAATSETNAATSETNAAASETAALAAQAAAEAAQDAIDGLYLGAQASDPTLDLLGNALTAGDWYYNTTTDVTRIYDGSAWVNGAVNTSSFLLSGNNLSDLGSAATARTNLGLATVASTGAYSDLSGTPSIPTSGVDFDPVGTDNSTNVTLAGTYNYLTLTGQQITLGQVDYSTDIANTPTIPTAVSQLTNDSGYLTSYTETDPVYTASSWYTTTNNSTNWNTAYGWGDHSTAGYLTSFTETDPVVGAITGIVKADGAGNISAAVAGTDYLASYTTELSEDTSPQLGGDLDTNGNAIDFGATGWSIALSGTDLVFSYNGTAKVKFASNGEIITVDDVTAFGTV